MNNYQFNCANVVIIFKTTRQEVFEKPQKLKISKPQKFF